MLLSFMIKFCHTVADELQKFFMVIYELKLTPWDLFRSQQSVNSWYFFKPEGLVLNSQESAIDPFLDPDKSSPQPLTYFLRTILILSPYVCIGVPRGLFTLGFPTRTFVCISIYVLISHNYICDFSEEILLENADYIFKIQNIIGFKTVWVQFS